MKKFMLLLLAALGFSAYTFAQETTSVLDLSKVDVTQYWEGDGLKTADSVAIGSSGLNGIPIVIDGKTVDGAYYIERNTMNGTSLNTRGCCLYLTKDLTLSGAVTLFGLEVGADVTLTLNGVDVQPGRLPEKDGATTPINLQVYAYPLTIGSYNVTLALADGSENIFASKGFSNYNAYQNSPGIYVPTGSTLTITGDTGKLTASGGSGWMGAPGIGVAYYASGVAMGNINIEGGHVIANGNAAGSAPGIGVGIMYPASSANHGKITISGGVVEATGSEGAPGIGTGEYSGIVQVEITGGKVTAKGGNSAPGIGVGNLVRTKSSLKDYELEKLNALVTISGTAEVEAIGGVYAPAIGGSYYTSYYSPAGTTIIKDSAKVTATAGAGAVFAIGPANNLDADGSYVVEGTAEIVANGFMPDGAVAGAGKLDISTLESPYTIADTSFDSWVLTGTKEDFELTVPDGTQLILDGEVVLKSLTVTDAGTVDLMTVALSGTHALEVGTLNCGSVDVLQHEFLEDSFAFTVTDSAAGIVNASGACTITLPKVENVGEYVISTTLTTTTDEAGKFPHNYTDETSFDLSYLTVNAIIPEDSGYKLETYSDGYRLTIPANAELTQSKSTRVSGLTFYAQGDVTLNTVNVRGLSDTGTLDFADDLTAMNVILKGKSFLSNGGDAPVVHVDALQTLTFNGDGALLAQGLSGAGIGSFATENGATTNLLKAGTILFPSTFTGTVVGANPGGDGAGIGGGSRSGAIAVEIYGGTVVGISSSAAGIGSGSHEYGDGEDVSIKIAGGKVIAYAVAGAAIGVGGQAKDEAIIDISSGEVLARTFVKPTVEEVNAILGDSSPFTAEELLALMVPNGDAAGAAIGAGQNSSFGSIKISGGSVNAASSYGAAVGGGSNYASGKAVADTLSDIIEITGGTITASSANAAAIGAGSTMASKADNILGTIAITGGEVTATTGLENAPAIGGTGYTGVRTIAVTLGDGTTGAVLNGDALDTMGSGTASTTEPVIEITSSNAADVCRIGSTCYTSLQAALDVATDGQTIILLQDVTTTVENVPTYAGTGTVTIDVSGHTLTSTRGLHGQNILFTGGFGWYTYRNDPPGYAANEPFIVSSSFETAKAKMDVMATYQNGGSGQPSIIELYDDFTMTEDITLPSTHTTSAFQILEDYDVTFDLAGHTITQNNCTGAVLGVFRVYGDFTLVDSSADGTGTVIAAASNGTNASGALYNSGVAIAVSAPGATVTLEGGTLTDQPSTTGKLSQNGLVTVHTAATGSTVTINGADLVAENGYFGVVPRAGTVEVNEGSSFSWNSGGCDVYGIGSSTDVSVNKPNTKVNGTATVTVAENLVKIGSWVIKKVPADEAICVIDFDGEENDMYFDSLESAIEIANQYGYTISLCKELTLTTVPENTGKTVAIYPGEFTFTAPEAIQASTTILLLNTYAWDAGAEEGMVTAVAAVAKIGDKGYATLQAALDAATEGQTITLLTDVTTTAENVPAYAGTGTVTIDINGHTLTATCGLQDTEWNWEGVGPIEPENIQFTGGYGWFNYTYASATDAFVVYPTLDAALVKAAETKSKTGQPSIICLYDDFTVPYDITLPSTHTTTYFMIPSGYEVTVDLNGKTVTQEPCIGQPSGGSFTAYGGKLTLIDSSDVDGVPGTGTGKVIGTYSTGTSNIVQSGQAIWACGDSGEVTLKSGTLTSEPASQAALDLGYDQGVVQAAYGAKITIDGATIVGVNLQALKAFNADMGTCITFNSGEVTVVDPEKTLAAYNKSGAIVFNKAPTSGAVKTDSAATTTVNVAGVQYEGKAPAVAETLATYTVNGENWVLEEGVAANFGLVSTTGVPVVTYTTLAAALEGVTEAANTIHLLANTEGSVTVPADVTIETLATGTAHNGSMNGERYAILGSGAVTIGGDNNITAQSLTIGTDTKLTCPALSTQRVTFLGALELATTDSVVTGTVPTQIPAGWEGITVVYTENGKTARTVTAEPATGGTLLTFPEVQGHVTIETKLDENFQPEMTENDEGDSVPVTVPVLDVQAALENPSDELLKHPDTNVQVADVTATTVTVYDPTLVLEGVEVEIVTKTAADTPETVDADSEAMVILDAAYAVETTTAEAPKLSYAYDFGIVDVTYSGSNLTSVTAHLTEGVDAAPRSDTLSNAVLEVVREQGGTETVIGTLPSPTFTDGDCVVLLENVSLGDGLSNIKVRLKHK